MTQAALARLVNSHVPAIIYRPSMRKTQCDTIQRSVDRYVGYRALWMKVVIRAAFDWVSYRDSTKLEHKKIAEYAFTWLFTPSELFNSFENICQAVDLPPDKIRAWARKLTKEHVAKIEHLERDSTNPISLAEAERRLIEQTPDEGC
jgi:hypothetical protein